MAETETTIKPAVRVLHVFGKLGLGGAETRVVDLYRHMDRRRVQFDFLVHTEEEQYYDAYVLKMGARLFRVPRFTGANMAEYKKALTVFFASHEGEWTVVQGHMTSTAAIYLPIAKKYAKPLVTAAHARSAGTDPGVKGAATKLLRYPLSMPGTVDERLACSEEAAAAVFGKSMMERGKVRIIPNALEIERFAYDEDARDRLRTELKVPYAIVIGHVGRFHFAKNHTFLLQVFAALKRLVNSDYLNRYSMLHGLKIKLMLLGEGELLPEIQQLAVTLRVDEDVLFLHNRTNAWEYYQAMDYFLFPSRYEGLPGTVIEAQAAGLQCLISNRITEAVDVTRLVSRMDLNDSVTHWAEKILHDLMLESLPTDPGGATLDERMKKEHVSEYSIADREASSADIMRKLKAAGFDVVTQAREMAYFYEKGRFPEKGGGGKGK